MSERGSDEQMTSGSRRPSLLKKYERTTTPSGVVGEVADDQPRPEYLSLAVKRGWVALPYTDIVWMSCDPSSNITIIFSAHTVTIRGTHLLRLYKALLADRISELRQSQDEELTKDSPDEVSITAIEIIERTPDKEDGEVTRLQ